MAKEAEKFENRVSDFASVETLIKAENDCVQTCFTRVDAQHKRCTFGMKGICCRICYMGPCRIIGIVIIAVLGINLIPLKQTKKYTHALAGGSIFLCGMAIQILGL